MRSDRRVRWVSWREPGLVVVTLSLIGVLAVVLSSCSVFEAIFPPSAPPPRPFNHEAHTVRGIGCADCHEGAEKEVKAGMPSKAFCMNCHDDLDKEKDKPLEKKVAWFLGENGEPDWAAFGRQKQDIKFSHGAHAGKVACAGCHVGMDKDTGLIPRGPQRMTSCVSCHQEKAAAKLECAACHQSIDRTRKPDNHLQLWTKMHGAASKAGSEVSTANTCTLCHQPNACVICHQTRPPQDHNEFWRLKSHGLSASLDRSRCQTCHTTDSCSSCHKVTAPMNHTAGWNAPREGHCRNCHVPLQSSGSCAVCHRDAPGHAFSPPKPPWHTPAMVCTACHSTSLKHPDNGDNCNACHR
ncbi:MAG: cytochrome c3 family protein [Planctomycetes bacterium]|nr:cytochrome c3 family protein [Planctomycetota bacterium]